MCVFLSDDPNGMFAVQARISLTPFLLGVIVVNRLQLLQCSGALRGADHRQVRLKIHSCQLK